MTIRSIIFTLALFSISLFFSTTIYAAPRLPTASRSVQATATVVHPLGILTESALSDQFDNNLWMIRYPSSDGIQMTVHLDGDIVKTIKLDEIGSPDDQDRFSIINPYDRVIQGGSLAWNDGTIVITLISTTQ